MAQHHAAGLYEPTGTSRLPIPPVIRVVPFYSCPSLPLCLFVLSPGSLCPVLYSVSLYHPVTVHRTEILWTAGTTLGTSRNRTHTRPVTIKTTVLSLETVLLQKRLLRTHLSMTPITWISPDGRLAMREVGRWEGSEGGEEGSGRASEGGEEEMRVSESSRWQRFPLW